MPFVDITRTLGLDTLTWPQDPAFQCETVASTDHGDAFNLARLDMADHTGTHLDSPAHFIADAPTVDRIPLERLFGVTAHVVEVPMEAGVIEPQHFDQLPIQPGEAVLFKTLNSFLHRSEISENYCHLSPQSAELLVALQAGLVGIDYLSPDSFDSEDFPVHRRLLQCGILLLEDLDLRMAHAGACKLYCLPLKLTGTSGAPCRAVLEI